MYAYWMRRPIIISVIKFKKNKYTSLFICLAARIICLNVINNHNILYKM